MAAMSLGRAVGSGFELIKQRPASVLVWGLLLVLLVQAPTLILTAWVGSDLVEVWRRGGPLSPASANELAFAIQTRMALVQVMMLPALVVRALIVAAVYRAVLEPQRRGLAYLRIGRQEGWLTLLALCVWALAYFAIIPLELIVAAAVITGVLLKGYWWLMGPAVGIVGVLVLLWAVARLSLAAPMTFADRNFRLFESWRLTRRNGWSLLGLGVVMVLLLVGLELLLVAVVAVVVAVVFAGRAFDANQALAWLHGLSIQTPGQMAVWLVPTGLVAAAVYGAFNAIAIAPWASAYQQLNKGPGARA